VPEGLLQPHWQAFSWQWHAFLGQPQAQVPQSQVPQQLDLAAAFCMVGFFTLDIVFLLFLLLRVSRFHRG
jgi:hypothetical protein